MIELFKWDDGTWVIRKGLIRSNCAVGDLTDKDLDILLCKIIGVRYVTIDGKKMTLKNAQNVMKSLILEKQCLPKRQKKED